MRASLTTASSADAGAATAGGRARLVGVTGGTATRNDALADGGGAVARLRERSEACGSDYLGTSETTLTENLDVR